MYEETQKRKTVRGFKSFLGIILLVYGILALMFIVGYVQTINQISYLQYILIAGLVVFGITFLRNLATEYVYIITQDGVRIIRKTGEKQRMLIEFHIKDIIRFGRLSEVTEVMMGKKKLTAVIGKKGPDAIYIVLKSVIVVLNPTGVFTQKIKEAYEEAYR